MTRTTAGCRLLAVSLTLLFALLGCASHQGGESEASPELDRWLSEQDGETDTGVPERSASPPRTVPLESLRADEVAAATEADVPPPEYFSFELPEPRYVSIAATSTAGAAISLIDRSTGVLARAGAAGTADGRIDRLLDAGEYRVSVETAIKADTAEIAVTEFREMETRAELLMRNAPGELHTTTLNDGEHRSYWVHVAEDEPLVIEAMGRALREVRIWKDGVWVVPEQPAVSEYSPMSGQPMGHTQMTADLAPGDYLVTFYGGVPREWAEDATGNPFYVRRGARYLGDTVDARTRISPLGRDAFLVSGDVTVIEVENTDFVPVTIGVAGFGRGANRYRPNATASIRSTDESTRSRTSTYRGGTLQWLFVVGTPGDQIRIRAIPRRTRYEIDEPTRGSQYLISTISTLDSDHAIDATPVITADRTRERREEVLSANAIPVSDGSPLVREINLNTTVVFTVDLRESGRWALIHDRPKDALVATSIVPLRDAAHVSSPDVTTENPATFDLDAGTHLVVLRPTTPGVVRFALYRRGLFGGASDRRAASLLEGDIAPPRADTTVITAPNRIEAGRDHTVSLNDRSGPTSALFVERLPLSLSQPVPLTIEAGEQLEIPIFPSEPGRISTGYDSIQITRNGRRVSEGDTIPDGRSTLAIRNSGRTATTFVLRLDPIHVASFSAPEISRLEDALPLLAPGETVFHDYARRQTRQFLLRVESPAFYELQTTGRLATAIVTRTQVDPQGFSAQSNGPGRNARVQAFFRPGDYLVEVRTVGVSAGRAGLIMKPLEIEDLGRLSEGAWHRSEVAAGVGLSGTVVVSERGRFSFETVGLYGSPTTRLEDADAWPVLGDTLVPGVYTYYSWPQTVWNRRLVRYSAMEDPETFASDEPWPIELNGSVGRTWYESEGRTPDRFIVESPAVIPVSLSLPATMEWWIDGGDGARIAEGTGAGSFDLPQGDSTISVRAREENNRVGYRLSLSTRVLAHGVGQSVTRLPASLPVVVGTAGIYEFSSSGTWDVRAELRTTNDEPVVLARGDDRPGDWNFHIARYLTPGSYQLDLSQSFPGSGTVNVSSTLREEVWVEEQSLPFETNLRLDRTIVGVPFRVDRDGAAVRITSDSSATELALYRGEVLVAEGRNEIFVPLRSGESYVLRLRNASLDPTRVGVAIGIAETQTVRWDGTTELLLPPGAARVTNTARLAVTASPENRGVDPNLTSAIERPATPASDRVIAASGGTLWSRLGDEAVSLRALAVTPGPARVFNVTDDDVAFRVSVAEGNVGLLEARTMAGHLGLNADRFPWTPETRDWSAADVARSSTILGVSSGVPLQAWLWDGAPQRLGRRVELLMRETPIVDTRELSSDALVSVPATSAIEIPAANASSVRAILSPGLVAVASNGGRTLATVAAGDANRSARLPGGGTIYLVNTGRREAIARLQDEPRIEPLRVTAATPAQRMLAARETVTVAIEANRTDGILGVWAVDPAEVVLFTETGRRIEARPPGPDAPYWTLPSLRGTLRVHGNEGPLAAWIESGDDNLQWIAQGSGSATAVNAGSYPMLSQPQRWTVDLSEESFVLIATQNRGVTMLQPEDDAGRPLVAMGSGVSRRIFAVLGPGRHTVVTRPLAGEPQPDPLGVQILQPARISETLDAEPLFLAAHERTVFGFEVASDGAVGVGLETETDDFTTYLLDDELNVLGSGRLFYRTLTAGSYYLLAENGDSPMRATPVILADRGSRTGVPEDVIENYREN